MTTPEEAPPGWTDPERLLWNSFIRGIELDLSDSNPNRNDPSDGSAWGPERTVRAEAVSHLLLSGPKVEDGSPQRLRLYGARVSGQLDLGCSKAVAFAFRGCSFDNAPFLNDAQIEFIGFNSCFLPGLQASRVACAGPIWLMNSKVVGEITLTGAVASEVKACKITAHSSDKKSRISMCDMKVAHDVHLHNADISMTVDLRRSEIGGDICLCGTKIDDKGTDGAVLASLSKVEGDIHLGDGFISAGLVSLKGATVGGQISLTGAKLSNPGKTVLDVDHVDCRLGFFAKDCEFLGCLSIHHAKIGCQLALIGSKLINPKERAFNADHLVVRGSLLMSEVEISGICDLHGSSIDCAVSLSKSKLASAQSDRATVIAYSINVGGDFICTEAEIDGGVTIAESKIAGDFLLDGTRMTGEKKYALSAARTSFGRISMSKNFSSNSSILLSDATVATDVEIINSKINVPGKRAVVASRISVTGSFIANGTDIVGSLDLSDAVINGDVKMLDSNLRGIPRSEHHKGSPKDPKAGKEWLGISLQMSGARVSGDVDFAGCRFSQQIRMDSASIDRSLSLNGAQLDTDCALALSAVGLTATSAQFTLKTRPRQGVDLRSARIKTMHDDLKSWPEDLVNIEGMTYERIVSPMTVDERLQWLGKATKTFSAQPYSELSACYSRVGQEDQARRIAFAATRRSYEDGNLPLRVWGKIQDFAIGYGYRPLRAFAVLSALWILGSTWFIFGVDSCIRVGVTKDGLCSVRPNDSLTWDPWTYSLDLLIPVVNLGHKNAWDATGWSKAVVYLLIAAGWIFTTTIIAAAGRKLKRS
ncbi:hypothetical protein OG205_35790 [Lentzea sp. NBC_00516]|uniref:hypothetical protein n=1 Tax=Lentzea sp. NBC_00516 TaxID=2903582 RepID=UPI002E81E2A1|nr:hypothetical protein [Lentzea sp. NBC_00516]WUD23379.1 hypothetical protein OG205_35790 [Lentzea sp. NBC_00516]